MMEGSPRGVGREHWLADLCVEAIGSQGKKEPSEKASWSVSSAYNKLETAPVPNSQNGKLHIHGALSRILTVLPLYYE